MAKGKRGAAAAAGASSSDRLMDGFATTTPRERKQRPPGVLCKNLEEMLVNTREARILPVEKEQEEYLVWYARRGMITDFSKIDFEHTVRPLTDEEVRQEKKKEKEAKKDKPHLVATHVLEVRYKVEEAGRWIPLEESADKVLRTGRVSGLGALAALQYSTIGGVMVETNLVTAGLQDPSKFYDASKYKSKFSLSAEGTCDLNPKIKNRVRRRLEDYARLIMRMTEDRIAFLSNPKYLFMGQNDINTKKVAKMSNGKQMYSQEMLAETMLQGVLAPSKESLLFSSVKAKEFVSKKTGEAGSSVSIEFSANNLVKRKKDLPQKKQKPPIAEPMASALADLGVKVDDFTLWLRPVVGRLTANERRGGAPMSFKRMGDEEQLALGKALTNKWVAFGGTLVAMVEWYLPGVDNMKSREKAVYAPVADFNVRVAGEPTMVKLPYTEEQLAKPEVPWVGGIDADREAEEAAATHAMEKLDGEDDDDEEYMAMVAQAEAAKEFDAEDDGSPPPAKRVAHAEDEFPETQPQSPEFED